MGQALYRKYRSRSLSEIVGQSHITSMLARAIKNERVAHAYLLTGPKGVGKTSIARILAHEINGLPYDDESVHLDIIEIDAASNNSVEDVRDLRDKVMIAPSSAKKKIYIIDEVHMLTKSAFNALLKTLEEPPEHVVFILATTDADKLPATIISRVQRFNFRAILPSDAASHLRFIADKENIDIDDEAIALIAQHGGGSFRDSIGLLDQLQNLSDDTITVDLVQKVLGLAGTDIIEQLLDAYARGDLAKIVALVDKAEANGTPAAVLADQLVHTVAARITQQPELLILLDKLLEVPRSAWPNIKLLTALASEHATPARQTPPPRTPKPVVVDPPIAKPKKAAEPVPVPKKPAATKPAPATTPTPTGEEQPFPWTDFLSGVKSQATGAYSLLTKCGYTYDGTSLTIYAGKKFTKAQIDKAMPALSKALQDIGIPQADIHVLAATKPPKDSQTAAVLAIMGGGEEVELHGE